ncbi:MAG: hypothetical protein IT307_09890 [Chloroflexi bacterium]|nr:hypothetical protein [Chloroflexota bacterium]
MPRWTTVYLAWDLPDSLPRDGEQTGWAMTNPDGSNGPINERVPLAPRRGERTWPWLTRA